MRLLLIPCIIAACTGGEAATEPESDVPSPPTPPSVALVRMFPESTSVVVGAELRLVASPEDSTGAVLMAETVRWESTDTTVATVDTTGNVSARSAGSVDLRAWVRGRAGRARLIVKPEPVAPDIPDATVAAVDVEPAQVSIRVGDKYSMSVTVLDSASNVLVGRSVTWQSWGPEIATVDTSGRVTAHAAGRAFVTASSEGQSETSIIDVALQTATLEALAIEPSTVTVTIGATQQFTVRGTWSDGTTSAPAVIWSHIGAGSVGTSGLYSAPATPGSYQVVASHDGGTLSDTANVSVVAASLTQLTISPSVATLASGAVQQFSASASWSDGSESLPSLTWTSLDGGTVTNTGRFTAPTTAGTYRVVVAHSGGTLRDTATIQVDAPTATVTSFVLTPGQATVQPGGTVAFSTATTWSDGVSRPVTVSYQATGGTMQGAVYRAGQVAGSFIVIAMCSCGAADTSSLGVGPSTVVDIAISPRTPTLQVGASQVFTATASWSGVSATLPPITFTAEGGTVNASTGAYIAPDVVGEYFVVLELDGTALRDTAFVTVKEAVPGDMYFNSAEAGCGTDPNIVLCDDFEDGEWYAKNCDQANSSGGLLQTDGWCGTIYNNGGMAGGTARCGGAGFKSDCAATTGVMSGSNSGNMADHALANGQGVGEIWVRFYTKPLTGYVFGAEKMLTFNDGQAGGGGIRWGNLSWNCAGSPNSTGRLTMGFPVPMDVCQGSNVENLTIESGNWYFYEVHYRLSAPGQSNGVFELWVDNCGPTGAACPASPTLRIRRTDIQNGRSSTGELIRVLWFEAWSNPVSQGERYWDQIKVSKVGPIGFMP